MEGINKKNNLEIEVLTPLSIGAGQEKDWVRGVDFVVDKSRLYKLNLKKMIANGVDINDLTGYFASKNELGLKSKLAGKLDDVSDFTMPFPVETDNDVKAFVKNQLGGNPVLTGSSLKGALRSVLFQYLDGKSKDGKEVFGSSKDGDEFMRFIKISDAEFDKTELVNTKIFNLRGNGNNWQGGWKFSGNKTDANFQSAGFNTLYESLMPKQKGYASLMMSLELYDAFEKNNEKNRTHIKTDKKRPILQNDIQTLVGIINQHTKDYLEKEKAFFEKFHAERSDEIVDSIDALLNQIPSDDSCCILKMSAGSGFHSITGDWQFPDDYFNGNLDRKRASKDDLKEAGKVLPKSRKIADWDGNLSLMGFVKLRALSEEDMKRLEENRQAERQRKEQERLAELEAIRIKAEEAAKEQREKEDRKKQFEQSLAEIKHLVDAEQFEDAWSKYQSLCDAFPEQKQTTIDVDYLKGKATQMQTERALKENAERQEQERLQAQKEKVEGGLSKLLNEKYEFGPNEGNYKVTSFKVCAQKVSSWMNAASVAKVPIEQQSALFDTVKRLIANPDKKEKIKWNDFNNSAWLQISKFVGSDTASQWLEEITKK